MKKNINSCNLQEKWNIQYQLKNRNNWKTKYSSVIMTQIFRLPTQRDPFPSQSRSSPAKKREKRKEKIASSKKRREAGAWKIEKKKEKRKGGGRSGRARENKPRVTKKSAGLIKGSGSLVYLGPPAAYIRPSRFARGQSLRFNYSPLSFIWTFHWELGKFMRGERIAAASH